MNDYNKFMTVGLLSVIGITIIFSNISIPKMITKQRLTRAARIARSQDLQTGYCFTNIQDWWENDICIKRELAKDEMAVGYMAISAGKDKTFETNDDISVIKVDLNKSKIIGKWAGERAKEVAKGLREGIFAKSKFNDAEGKKEIGDPDKPETKRFNWKFWKHER